MKRLLLLAFFIECSLLPSVAQQAYYLYTSDRQIEPFFFEYVDSMTVSKMDVDSVLQDSYVTQEIWMADTVFRIPLDMIDSICYQTPATIYTEETQIITPSLSQYVIRVDSLSILFSNDIPRQMLPSLGTKLVQTEQDSVFPNGFMGRVKQITNDEDRIIVDCEQVFLTDVFERYYKTVSTAPVDNNARREIGNGGNFDTPINLGELSISVHDGLSTPFVFGTDLEGAVELEGKLSFPDTRVAGCLIFEREMGTFFSVTLRSSIKLEGNLSLSGSISKDIIDLCYFPVDIVMLIPPSCYLYGKVGAKMGIEGNVNFGADLSVTWPFATTINASTKTKADLPTTWFPKFGKPKFVVNPLVVSGDVKIKVGAYFEEGLVLLADAIAKLALRHEAGVEFGLHAQIGANEIEEMVLGSTVYEQMQKRFKWELTPYYAFSAEGGLLGGKKAKQEFNISYGHPFFEAKLLPSFQNVTYRKENGKITLCADVNDNVLPAIPVGFCIEDEDSIEVYKEYFIEKYQRYFIYERYDHYEIEIPDTLKANKKYTVYPIVKLFDLDAFQMKASPACEIKLEVTPVTDAADGIHARDAVLHGHLLSDFNWITDDVRAGFVYGTTENVVKETGMLIEAKPDLEGHFKAEISNLKPGTVYYYRACVIIDNVYIYSDIINTFTTLHPIKIVDFKQTGAKFWTKHYDYNGEKYSFKYDVTTSIRLDDDRNVENWGYIYEDLEGRKLRISLMGAPNLYEDKRISYYRNEPSSVVKLYPFVKYTDEKDYYYGEAKEYPVAYPTEAQIMLNGCEYVGTKHNVEYSGRKYDHCSTFRFLYDAAGGYWLKVETQRNGSGWYNWGEDLQPDQAAAPIDGSNALTVNYYYNKKTFKGDFRVYLMATDATHDKTYMSDNYVVYEHNGQTFTGCKFQKTVGVPDASSDKQQSPTNVLNRVISICYE